MSSKNDLNYELLSLVEAVREQARYFAELGAERIEVPEDVKRESAAQAFASKENVPAAKEEPRAFERSSPLARHADAAHRDENFARERTSDAPKFSPNQNQISSNETMPKRKPSPHPPAPEETLFGVVTPADELSLPKPNETFEDVRRDIGDCHRCPLWEGRTQIVNSEGDPQARLMFVGEAPGADEDASGHPFVGRAGQLLNKIIEAIGLRREDVFIGNVNRCRPPGNRTPTPKEAATCKPFLLREIAILKPDIIVVLGNTAMKNLLDTKEGITKLRGEFLDYKGVKVMPTFHPAYLLRDPTKKREVWQDMKKVRDYLNETKKGG